VTGGRRRLTQGSGTCLQGGYWPEGRNEIEIEDEIEIEKMMRDA